MSPSGSPSQNRLLDLEAKLFSQRSPLTSRQGKGQKRNTKTSQQNLAIAPSSQQYSYTQLANRLRGTKNSAESQQYHLNTSVIKHSLLELEAKLFGYPSRMTSPQLKGQEQQTDISQQNLAIAPSSQQYSYTQLANRLRGTTNPAESQQYHPNSDVIEHSPLKLEAELFGYPSPMTLRQLKGQKQQTKTPQQSIIKRAIAPSSQEYSYTQLANRLRGTTVPAIVSQEEIESSQLSHPTTHTIAQPSQPHSMSAELEPNIPEKSTNEPEIICLEPEIVNPPPVEELAGDFPFPEDSYAKNWRKHKESILVQLSLKAPFRIYKLINCVGISSRQNQATAPTEEQIQQVIDAIDSDRTERSAEGDRSVSSLPKPNEPKAVQPISESTPSASDSNY